MTRPTRAVRRRARSWTRGEALRLVRRGGWHGRTAMLLLVGSALMPGRLGAFRSGFFLLQHVDDLCDGDLPSADPLDRVDAIVADWRGPTERLRGSGIAATVAVLRATLAADPGGRGPDAIAAVERLMLTMRRDHDRRVARELWSAEQIGAHLTATFTDSIDLMLITSGPGTARSAQTPALVAAMCWCSVVRDFRADLAHGIVNIPADIVEDEHLVADWWDRQRAVARSHIDAARAEVAELAGRDRRAARAMRPFLSSLERWYTRTAQFPGLP